MGHGIGLSHSSTAPCNGQAYRPGLDGCEIREYGNRFNVMGGGLATQQRLELSGGDAKGRDLRLGRDGG